MIGTSGLTIGKHEVVVRTSLQGRSCAVNFTVIVAPPPPPPEENYQQVKIFYATDRKEAKRADHITYTADEADGESMAFGYALVSIPRDHRMGEMEHPSLWKVELRQDPNKLVVVLDTVKEDQKTFLDGVRKHLANNNKEVLIFYIEGQVWAELQALAWMDTTASSCASIQTAPALYRDIED